MLAEAVQLTKQFGATDGHKFVQKCGAWTDASRSESRPASSTVALRSLRSHGAVGCFGEFELIRRFFVRDQRPQQSRRHRRCTATTRRCSIWRPGMDLVAAVDTIVAGRHFPQGSDARSIGHRALAVNLSDIAAMGATPAWATLALTLPRADPAWLESFAAGLLELADNHAVALVGGDTTRGPLTVSVQIMGYVPHGGALCRSGARPEICWW